MELTKEDCEEILEYVQWLEEIAENNGQDVGNHYPSDAFQKIIDGK